MKFLVDESVEHRVVLFLRGRGFDVTSIAEQSPGLADADVLRLAAKHQRILVTNDKDFGTLIFLHRFVHTGVILLRLPDETAAAKIEKLEMLLSSYSQKLVGNYVVLSHSTVRIRRNVQ